MPSIKDPTTVKAIAQEYCGNGRDKAKAMKTIGYAESSCKSGRAVKYVYGNVRVKTAIAKIDAKTAKKHTITRNEIIEELRIMAGLDEGGKQVNNAEKIRSLELLGKHLAMFTDNIRQTGEGLMIEVSERKPDIKLVKAST